MANVTYLLGAGASFNALPTYGNFGDRFQGFIEFLKRNPRIVKQEYKAHIEEIVAICGNMVSEFSFHSTPDTIAKKYFHTFHDNSSKLTDLKIALVLFFMYEQCISSGIIEELEDTRTLKKGEKKQIEKRYDAFIASILKPTFGQLNIRPEFNVLTWNYDLQFELCFKNYTNLTLAETRMMLQSIPSSDTVVSDFKWDKEKFSIVHLNGVAYNRIGTKDGPPLGEFYNDKTQLMEALVEHYKDMKYGEYSFLQKGLMNFAWERDPNFTFSPWGMGQTMECAKVIAEKTEVLVVIGYSFPIFNREVDAALFSSMYNLKKIYVQSPQAKELKEIIVDIFSPVNNNINNSNVDPVAGLDYFHIPHEANRTIEQIDPRRFNF